MDYLIAFVGGMVMGLVVCRAHALGMQILRSREQPDRELLPLPTTPPVAHPPIEQDIGQKEVAKYRTMWDKKG